jgi:hypothetical protein
MDNEPHQSLRRALKRMPEPQPRPGFVDRALANATAAARTMPPPRTRTRLSALRGFVARWETWAGAALGAAAAVALTVVLLRPIESTSVQAPSIGLALNEAREIDVLIDSERDLAGATIRIVVTGGIALDGFDDEREIGWQANLQRGSNLLSLPVVARAAGKGQLVAVIEHDGRTRRVTVDLTVKDPKAS